MKVKQELAKCYHKVVVDTNVLLSATFSPQGTPAKLLDWILMEGRLVFTEVTFSELETRLWKPKFDRYLTIEQRQRLLREFNASACWVEVPSIIKEKTFSRDQDDDAFIHAAMAAEISRIISGDDDLLSLHPINTLHIVSPRAALDEINNTSGQFSGLEILENYRM